MTTLVEKVLAVHDAFEAAEIRHAFGGALALAYATEEPRGTRDIDVNVFARAEQVDAVLEALPQGVAWSPADRTAVLTDEQVRLWWEDTPVDLFFAADEFHFLAAARCRPVALAGRTITVLAPNDLAVFKVLFDRPKDWVDIANMIESATVDVDQAADVVAELLGDDPRVARLRQMHA